MGRGNHGKNFSPPIYDLRSGRTPWYNVSSRSIHRDWSRRSRWMDECLTGICRGNSLRLNGVFPFRTVSSKKSIDDFRNTAWKVDRENHRYHFHTNNGLSWWLVAGASRGHLSGFDYACNPSRSVLSRRIITRFLSSELWDRSVRFFRSSFSTDRHRLASEYWTLYTSDRTRGTFAYFK